MRRFFNSNSAIAFTILTVSFVISFTIVAHAQTAQSPSDEQVKASGIVFPIAELGNCASKDACLDYCNIPGNMPACIKYAKDHGLMNSDEANRAEKFKEKLDKGEGPGGCKSPQECKAFCENVSNIEVCTKFAKEHGVNNPDIERGEKIAAYIKSGGQTPGGCNSKEACETYCSDFRHAEECFQFAEKAGLTQVKVEVPGKAEGRFEGGLPPGQFQKFLEAIKKGETPGGCKSKEECEKYCSDPAHRDECINFAEKVGLIPTDQAEKIKQLGGKGPGDCNSPESCKAYCADAAHHDECYKFAVDHGFISAEKADEAKKGFVTLRTGLENAPPEVAECLKSTLGPNVISDIQTGKLTPGPEIGERVKGCFEKFGRKGDPTEPFRKAPPEVLACVKEKLGSDTYAKISSGEAQPTPEMGDAFRVCSQQFDITRKGQALGGMPPMQTIQNFIKTAPPQISECLKQKLGGDYEKIASGETQLTPEIGSKMKACFQEFRPPEVQFNPERKGFERKIEGGAGNLPPQVIECAKSVLGEDAAEKIRSGITSDLKEKLQPCIDKFKGNAPPPSSTGTVRPIGITLPTQVADCVRGAVGPEAFDKFTSGASPTTDLKNIVQACLEKFKGSEQPQPVPSTTQEKPSGTACIQVVTPAKDPQTGLCKQFPTPCDVPAGWVKCETAQ